MTKSDTSSIARFVFRIEFIPYVVFTVIGAAVLYTVGGIGIDALRHGSFLPPPAKVERFACTAPFGSFSMEVSQGTDRVKIKSINGALDGTVRNNRFDWLGFANDRAMLGFAPPAEMVIEGGNAMRLSGPDFKDLACSKVPEPAAQGRSTAL